MTFMFDTFVLAGSLMAYVGPGLGLGTLGVILGVLLSVVLAIIGVVWYPLKRLIRSFRRNPEASDQQSASPPKDE